MRYLILLSVLLFAGCCASKDTTISTQRDTVIVFKPAPVNLDSIIATLHFGHNPDCDTAEIVSRYSSLLFFWQDSVGQYRAIVDYLKTGKDSISKRLRFYENRQPQIFTVPVLTSWIQTQVQTIPFMQKLGLMFVGFLFCLGVVVGIKAFI